MRERPMRDHGRIAPRARWRAAALVVVLGAASASATAAQTPEPPTSVHAAADTAAMPNAPPAAGGVPEVTAPPARIEPDPIPLPPAADARSAFPVERRLEMRSTAYCLRGTMRTGVRVRDGMAAGDPGVLPLGSVVRVSHPDGRLVGIFVIMDTGGAVRGNKIDLWFASCREAIDWGVRPVIAEVLDVGRV